MAKATFPRPPPRGNQETALKLTNRKFRRRFLHIERGLRARGRELGKATIEEMEELWQEAKQRAD